MSKEFQISDGNLIASFDLGNEDGDIDFCKLLKVSHGVANEIGMFVDYIETNKIIKDQSRQISELEAKLKESEKYRKWVIEFLEKYKIKPDPAPEYSENPIIEYCKQVDDFRWCDEEENKQLKEKLSESESRFQAHKQTDARTIQDQTDLIENLKQQLTEKDKEIEEAYNFKKKKFLSFPLIFDISKYFAIEQLEQLRIRIKNRQKDWNTGVDWEFTDLLPDYDIYEEIDNQIKEIKGE